MGRRVHKPTLVQGKDVAMVGDRFGRGRAWPDDAGGGPRRGWWEQGAIRGGQAGGDETGPHRGRGPKNYIRSDERIREDVNDRLTDSPYVDASEIEVMVSKGEVTLSGMVSNRWEKRNAEDLAEAVSGVSYVQNNLRVQQQAATRVPDAVSATGVGGAAVGTRTDVSAAVTEGSETSGGGSEGGDTTRATSKGRRRAGAAT
jgi:hypothetical protein